MAISYPTSLDTFTNPSAGSPLNNPDHAGQHTDLNDAIIALQQKVGITDSADTNSLDYRINNLELLDIISGDGGTPSTPIRVLVVMDAGGV